MKTVEEMMVSMRCYPHAPLNLSLAEALVMMRMPRWQQKHPDGRTSTPHVLLVFDDDLEFIGIVRRHHILRALHPDYLVGKRGKIRLRWLNTKLDAAIQSMSEEAIVKGLRELAQKRLQDIMSPIKVVIEHDASLLQALRMIVQHDAVCLPVTKDGKLIGVLRRTDVLWEIEALLGVRPDEWRNTLRDRS
ncbi:MAG: CBS domain-containing protein [Planctomycetota bacterium]|jgi:CBS domain-containing protein